MTKYIRIVFLHIILLSNAWSINATSGIYKLKATICKVAPCYHPKNGFVFRSTPKEIPFNEDSFILDFNRKVFKWTDNKGSVENKMYKVQAIPSGYTFITEHHYARLIKTSNSSAILGIIISANDDWYYFEYKCIIY